MKILCRLTAAFSLALPALAMAAPPSIPEDELKRIDDFLVDYYRDVVITKRTLNAAREPIDCVDIRKQPGLNTPRAGGGDVQMEPSPELKALLNGRVSTPPPSTLCPMGSVEMRLPTKAQIIERGSLKDFQSNGVDPKSKRGRALPVPASSASTVHNGHYWAAANSVVNATGVQSTFNLWRPTVAPVPAPSDYFLFSNSQMWANGGGGAGGTGELQSIEAGTAVYQAMYGDQEAHFFIFWTADDYDETGCQDLRCKGFVVTSSVLPIGGKLGGSKIGGTQLEGTLAWYRDPATGNWILFLYDAVRGYQQIGYYPVGLFNGGQLSRYATRVSFGGEVFTPPEDAPVLPMGSGVNPLTYTGTLLGNVAYQRGLQYMDSAGVTRDFQYSSINWAPTMGGCAYGAKFFPAAAPYKPGWGSSLFYGGAGFKGTCVRP